MTGWQRWVVAIVAVAAIVAMVAFARGEPQHGSPKVAISTYQEQAG
jgi:hypothetical protein